MSDENLARLRDIYYDAETGFKGADETYKQAKAAGLTTGAGKLRHKDVKEFLKKQESRQVTKQFKRPTRFTSIRAKAVGEKYQTDLLEFGYKRNGYRFLLQVIDIHSRYAWSVPIRNKKGPTVRDAFQKVLQEAKRTKKGKLKLKHVHSDEGKEFLNRHFQQLMADNGIQHTYSYEGEYAKNSIVERYNLTLRQRMELMQGRFKIGEPSFQTVVRNYNKKQHRTIKASPWDVWNGDAKNTQHYKDMLYGFKKGDQVRLLFKKKLFEKGTYGWTKDVYRISKIVRQRHYVKGSDGRQVRDKKGRKKYFMGYQLQRADKVQRDPKVDPEETAKEASKTRKAKDAKRQERRLKKEGLDDAVPATDKKRKRSKKLDPQTLVGKRIKIKWDNKGAMSLGAERDRGKHYDKFYPGKVEKFKEGRLFIRYDDDKKKLYRLNLTDKRQDDYIPARNWAYISSSS